MEKEIWKDIIGYEKLYQVSSLGRIKSLSRNASNVCLKEKILKKRYDKKGYVSVSLYKDNDCKSFKIHRLVAIAFIENNENKPQVNHINGIKDDNKLENLEWVTNKENQIKAWETGLQKSKKYENNSFSKEVFQYDINNNFIKKWNCINRAKDEMKMKSIHISGCCKGKRKTAGGYIWKYEEKL